MARILEGLPGGLDSPLPLGDRCACGNTFMTDAVFCRKCGCRRGCQDIEEDNNDQVNRWDLFLEFNKGSLSSKIDEPRTLEIAYSPGGLICHEIVYEDPTETEKRPRLLVSLQSVLALKALCEREFERVEIITEVLKKCRTAYYKELCYLREQLYRVERPPAQVDHLYNFEVYWYDPREYIDHDLKVFLQECIRITNKKLIEENFDLIQKLKALGASSSGNSDDDHIKRMIRTMGPGITVRKLYGFLMTPEHGSEQKRKDFEIAVKDILKKGDKENNDVDIAKLEAEIIRLSKENEKLKKAAEENEAFKKRISELEKEITALGRGGQQAATMEAARADAEKARADEAQAKVESLESELDKMRKALKDLKDKEGAMGQDVRKLGQRIDQVVQRLDTNAKPRGAVAEGILGPIESSVSALEGCLVGVLAKISSGSGSQSEQIQKLEAQIKAAADRDAKYKLDIERLQKEAKRLKEERDAEALAAAQANARAQAQAGGGSEEVASLRDQLSSAREEIARLKEELEKNEKDYYTKFKSLESQLLEAEEKCRKPNGGASSEALAESERALAEMTERYERAQMKISDLKDQIKRLKALCGEPPDDSDSSDSNYDGEMPMFLMSYVKRTRNLWKPRWKHLSDDAKFAKQKRDFLFAQAHANTREFLGEAADEAFNFLRQKESRRGSALSQKSSARLLPSRSKTISFDADNDPVTKALKFQRCASSELLQDLEVLQSASNATGHHLDKFNSMSTGFKQSPSLEAAVAISASELGRPGTASKPSTADDEDNKSSKRTKRASTARSSEFFPDLGDSPFNSQQVTQESPTHSSKVIDQSAHETYESLLKIAGQERSGSAGHSGQEFSGSLNRGRSLSPPQRSVQFSTFAPPMIISGLMGDIEALSGSSQVSATLRSYDRGRIGNIEHLRRSESAGSQSASGSPVPGRRTVTHFPVTADSQQSTPLDRGRHRAPPRSQRSISRTGSQASSHSPTSQGIRSPALTGTRDSRQGIRSPATIGTRDSRASALLQSQPEAGSYGSPPRSSQGLALAQNRAKAESHESPPPLQGSSVRGRGLRKDVSESALEQSSKRHDAVVEPVESGTLSSLLSTAKTRSSQPKKTSDTFLAEASTSSVGSTTLPAEFSIASSFTSSPSRDKQPPKRAPQRLPAKTPTSHSRSLSSCATPPAGLAGRSRPFPPISSPSTLEFGCGPASFSPPLGQDSPQHSPLARRSQETLMSSTFPSPSRASPKALIPKRVAIAGDLPQPPREITWGMSISRSMGSMPFTNVKSAVSTMSTTSSSISPTKSKQKLATGADDFNKGHLPLLMPDFKPGRVHKGPLGMTSTLYVATI